MKRISISYERKKHLIGYAFVAPWILGGLYFFLLPLIQSVIYSVSEVAIKSGGMETNWVGFSYYYRALFTDREATQLLWSSLSSVLIKTVYIAILSLFVAVVLNQKFFGRTAARAVFFLPIIVTSGVVISIINGDSTASSLFTGTDSSTMVKSFELVKLLNDIGFPDKVTQLLTGLVDQVLNIAWVCGVQILILLSGLQTVPGHLYEAAKMDGASGWESFWFITFPMLSPMLLLTIIYSIVDGLSDYSNKYQKLILSYANTYLNFSYSAALSTIYMLLSGLFIGLVFLIARRYVFYMAD